MKNLYEIDRMAPFILVFNKGGDIYAESYEDAKDFLEVNYDGETITFPSAVRRFAEDYKEVHIAQTKEQVEELLSKNANRMAIETALHRL